MSGPEAEKKEQKYWIDEVADAVEAFAAKTHPEQKRIVCASGVTPSGNIHLGNLREIITVHLVTEELKRRGREAEHIHSWDDYDRFRKVPKGIPEEYEQYIGMAVANVPDPTGKYPSYADRFLREFEESGVRIGIVPRYIRQSQAYPRGDYLEGILTAMHEREKIFDVLAVHQTAGRHEEELGTRRAAYYPFKPYCSVCNKDTTTVTAWDEATTTLTYHCACGHDETYSLRDKIQGKLVWKADWPMRWAHEHVVFEPAGEEHAAPGSSRVAGIEIVKLFNWTAPYFVEYKFVGMGGRSKISSSAGGAPLPSQALDILEPAMVRWLYIRRPYNRHFDIDFGKEVVRLYDEWDLFAVGVASGEASAADKLTYERCIATSAGPVLYTKKPVSFRVLSAAADLTQGNVEQIVRLAQEHTGDATLTAADLEPRLSCAIHWVTQYLPEDERTHVREAFDSATYEALPEVHKKGIVMLIEALDSNWTAEALTHLLYGIPKKLLGLADDAEPTAEVKKLQREFFMSLYRLLCSSDTGPRLPTFFLSLGKERVKSLLRPVGNL